MSKELFEELDLTIAEIRKENQKLKKRLKDKEDYIKKIIGENKKWN